MSQVGERVFSRGATRSVFCAMGHGSLMATFDLALALARLRSHLIAPRGPFVEANSSSRRYALKLMCHRGMNNRGAFRCAV